LTLVQKLCPELNPAAYGSSNVEYVHAGDLFYASDAANEFYYSGSEGFSAFAGSTLLKALDEGFSWLSGEKKSFDWFLPMPKEMLDGGRAIGTFATIMSHLATDRFDFLNDHGFAYLDQRFGRWLRS
jgi:hypothetical protein